MTVAQWKKNTSKCELTVAAAWLRTPNITRMPIRPLPPPLIFSLLYCLLPTLYDPQSVLPPSLWFAGCLTVSGTSRWMIGRSDWEADVQAERQIMKKNLQECFSSSFSSSSLLLTPYRLLYLASSRHEEGELEEGVRPPFPQPFLWSNLNAISFPNSLLFLLLSIHSSIPKIKSTISSLFPHSKFPSCPFPQILQASKHSVGSCPSRKMLSSSRMKGMQHCLEIRGYLLSDWLVCRAVCGF